MFQTNTLKARLVAGETAFGCWVGGGSPTNAEILGHAGFDFLLLDHEHGVGDAKVIVDELRAVAATPTPAVVRVPWNDPVYLKRVLDIGVQAVMIPAVDTAEAAEAAVRACFYPPEGIRGYAAGVVRASTYGNEKGYVKKANAALLTILQMESATAVENAEAICAIGGIDVVFIGVNDLAGSIGRLEDTGHPEVQALVRRAEAVILSSGKIMGTVPSAGGDVAALLDRGYRMIAGPHDVALLRDAAASVIGDYRALLSARGTGERGKSLASSY